MSRIFISGQSKFKMRNQVWAHYEFIKEQNSTQIKVISYGQQHCL